MRFDQFLTRADEEVLQKLLGTDALRLLRALDPNGFTQSRQRKLLLEQASAQELLGNSSSRRILLNLLRPDETQRLCKILGFDSANPYAVLQSKSFTRNQISVLLDFFELAQIDDDGVDIVENSTSINPRYPLFVHQHSAALCTRQKLRSGPRRVLLHMPTGAGKTRTAMNVICEHFREHPNKTIIWLAHSEELCEQAASEFEKAWECLGSHEVIVNRFWGNRDLRLDLIKGSFIVAGLSKFYALIKRSVATVGKVASQVGLVIMDEAHQAIAETYQLILDALVHPYPDTSLLGLSATPGRSWNNVELDEQLARFFSYQKVTLQIDGYDNPVDYLVSEEYLASVSFRSIFVDSDFEITESDKAEISNTFKIPVHVLRRLAEHEMRNLQILSEVERLIVEHNRIIVFATTVEHSDVLAVVLRARGIWAFSVTASTSGQERVRILEEFRENSKQPKVVCNFGVLTAGFDAPKTSAALIARPTTSLVLFSQMVGRATRGRLAGGNKNAEIVTVVDSSLPGFGNMAEAFFNWEDVWE